MCNCTSKLALRAPPNDEWCCPETDPQKEKGPTRVGPVLGITPPANRPDPDGPGGLGAEESGTERTGSTQAFFVASQRGGRWAEVGQQYDSANVPVTRLLRYRTT